MKASLDAAQQSLCSTALHFCSSPVLHPRHCGIILLFQTLEKKNSSQSFNILVLFLSLKHLSNSRLINHSCCYSTNFYLLEKEYRNFYSVRKSDCGRKNNLNYRLQWKDKVLSFPWRSSSDFLMSKRFIINILSFLNSLGNITRMLVYCQSFAFIYTLPSKKNQNWYISKNNFGLDSTARLEKNPKIPEKHMKLI